jgi:hypothetical protein
MFTLYQQRIFSLQVLQTQSVELLQSIQLLRQGKISPRLIPINTIEKLYENINQDLATGEFQYTTNGQKSSTFYDNPNFSFYSTINYLYISIKIPITMYKSIFEVYKTFVFPVPVSHNVSSKIYTTYSNVAQYIAVSNDDIFLELTEDQYSSCRGSPISYCSTIFPRRTLNKPTCTISLWLDKKELIQQSCHSTLLVYPNIPQNIIELDKHTYLFTGPVDSSTWSLKCLKPRNDDVTQLEPCTMCQIKIPCNCILETNNFIVEAPIADCEKQPTKKQTIEIKYQYNLNFLQNWLYNESVLDTLNSVSFRYSSQGSVTFSSRQPTYCRQL